MQPRSVGLWMATTTALSWAILAIGLKFAVQSISSGTIVSVRMIIAFFVMLIYYALRQPAKLEIIKNPPTSGIIAGILIAANYYGFMKCVELTTASNAQIMIQMAPMTFTIISIFYFRETPSPLQALGILTAFTGFGFFYWDQILVAVQQVQRFQLGNLWVLMAAMTWAVFATIQKVLIRRYDPQQFNLLIYGVSAVALLPLGNFSELKSMSSGMGILLLFLSLNTVVAYGAFAEALQRIPASHVSMIISANPLLTVAIMTYLTQIEVEWIAAEPIHWRGFLGAFLVVTGVLLTVAIRPRPALMESKA